MILKKLKTKNSAFTLIELIIVIAIIGILAGLRFQLLIMQQKLQE